ncbi:hemolysin family protein [Leptolyngbya sp. FACHB-261]|uniref:hemolysin family protein n=1 Tax=Leptolyngbya sp. FACHB-261 TaxID=2692806 RepID=UPI0016862D2E|nr:hemolysin family protein [Leptolyngbya sp. FACHB-261]MBD2104785.1 HlyC/CorC family transporter [Leptolyngbya sp. FACHB-261]
MEVLPQLGLVVLLIAINAFFAAAEIALVSSDPTRLEVMAKAGSRRARQALKLSRDSTRFLATIQIGITLAAFFTSAAAAVELSLPLANALKPLLGPFAKNAAFFAVTVVVSLVSLIFGELTPKRLALRHAESVALFTVMPIAWLGKLASPLVHLLTSATNTILGWVGGNAHDNEETRISLDEIRALIEAAREGGTLGEQERRMIMGVVGLSRLTARAVMVPRVRMQAISVNTSLAEAYNIAAQNAHTRLPVYDQDIDHIQGVLHVKDLVWPQTEAGPYLSDGGPTPNVRELMRPVRFVPEYKRASDILREMQKGRLHLVVVTDEYGGTAGLITLEDLLEEIVGEIRDEYDAEEEAEFLRLGPHKGIFNVRASLSRVNNELGSDLPRDQAATLAGLFLAEFNQLPTSGDRLQIESVELLVLEDGQRVRVTYTPPTTTAEMVTSDSPQQSD